MGHTLQEMLARLPEDERAKVETRSAELIADEMSLQELRKAMNLTQARMADMLGVGQDSISRLEQRTDMLLSTLRSYVEAAGGELVLEVRFPGRPPVHVKSLGDGGSATAARRRAS